MVNIGVLCVLIQSTYDRRAAEAIVAEAAMATAKPGIEALVRREYKQGFVTELEADSVPPGLNEDIVRLISTKKGEPEFMRAWRLQAYRHWLTITEPRWAHVHYPPIDYQSIIYFFAPKSGQDRPKSLADTAPTPLA